MILFPRVSNLNTGRKQCNHLLNCLLTYCSEVDKLDTLTSVRCRRSLQYGLATEVMDSFHFPFELLNHVFGGESRLKIC